MKNDLFKTVDQETKEKLIQQGEMKGRIDERIKMALELLKLNMNITDIMQTTKLTKQEIQTLQKQIPSK